MTDILFAKTKPDARIPSRRKEDAAIDLYACFDEDYIIIQPFTSKLVSTGIASSFDEGYAYVFRERGSTGVKNIKINAGVIDSGYRNEWFVCIYNANQVPLIISKIDAREIQRRSLSGGIDLDPDHIYYSYEKAIAQAILIQIPDETIIEIEYDILRSIKSERMMGMLGSSQK